jgi:hypothetical protein
MKKKKVILSAMVLTLTLASQSVFAGFECTSNTGLNIDVKHLSPVGPGAIMFPDKSKQNNSKVTVSKDEAVILETEVFAAYYPNRIGGTYKYKFDKDKEVDLFISETSTIVKKPLHCKPGMRITCDYIFESSFQGHLELNGDQHVLDCEAN